MQQLLGNVGFWGVIAAIITYIVSPILTEKVRKIGEKNNELLEKTIEKIDVQSGKIDDQNQKIDSIDKELKLQGEAILGNMRYDLVKSMNIAIKRGYTTSKEIDDIHDLLEPYRKMGGNGAVDVTYSKFKELKIDNTKGEIL